ncbi:MAG: hypothetical protein RRX92_04505 [Lachnospiraceae bacterium]
MEYYLFIGIIVLVCIFAAIKGFFDQKKHKNNFMERCKREYGQYPDKDYNPEQYASISQYDEKHRNAVHIDDITWNDLEMDRLFRMMNMTYSSAGEEYLYHILRTPKMSAEELTSMEALIDYFMTHEDDRVQMQVLFASLGKTGKFSLYNYLDYLDNLGYRSNKKQIIVNLLYVVALLLAPLSITVSIALLAGLVCYNMATYFKEKSEIAPYIVSFHYIMRLLHSVDRMQSLTIAPIASYKESLLHCRQQLRNFTKRAQLAMVDSASGNPFDFLLDYVKMIFHIDIMKFNTMLSEIKQKTDSVDEMVRIFGYIESCIAIGSFRTGLPFYCTPTFGSNTQIKIEDAYHPYLTDAIANSIEAKRGVLLTGSNASGKSTFLKTIALNAIMAQTVHTVAAKQMETSYYHIYSSMSLRDDLSGGESYYMVEIKSLKRILDAAGDKECTPVLCFVDEVLRGTNTVERIAASTQILQSLARPEVICFAATHDIELTTLLKQTYDNYHFTEEVIDGDVLFSYKLLDGSATTRNAIQLLSMIGYQKDIIESAAKMAETFVDTGQWH